MTRLEGGRWRRYEAAIGIGLWFLFLIGLGLFCAKELADSPVFIYGTQVLSGNWSPDKRDQLIGYGGDVLFIFGAFVAIAINLITLGAIIKLVYELAIGPWSTKVATSLKAALRTRDVTTESAVLNSIEASLSAYSLTSEQIEEVKDRAHEAFVAGVKHWQDETLPRVFHGSRREKLLQYLRLVF